MEEYTKCVIWGTPAKDNHMGDGREIISARTGGSYFVSGTGEALLEHYDDSVKVRLTDWLVEQRRFGIRCPEITANTVLDAEVQWEDLGAATRADNTLRYLKEKTNVLGEPVHHRTFYGKNPQLDDEETTYLEFLAHSSSIGETELSWLLKHLEEKRWVECNRTVFPPSCTLTVEGNTRLDELGKTLIPSREGFVAMWFDDSMNDALEKGFKPAISAAGYKPVRIDQREHPNKIDDEIIAGIRRARFMVADFTYGDDGERGGVYYEAGFAHGLNIPVFFTCRKGFLEKIHFDTRQYNHIEWEGPEDLREALKNRITAHIGYGPHKPADE